MRYFYQPRDINPKPRLRTSFCTRPGTPEEGRDRQRAANRVRGRRHILGVSGAQPPRRGLGKGLQPHLSPENGAGRGHPGLPLRA